METKGDGKELAPAGVKNSGVVIQRRMIAWTPEGLPVPVSVPQLSKAGIEELATTALSLTYRVPPLILPLDPGRECTEARRAQYELEREAAELAHEAELEFEGMTNAEVMIIKLARAAAAGDKDATSAMMDRVLGRPKQSVESKSLKLTYEDYLKEMARGGAAAAESERAEVVEVEGVETLGTPEDGLEGLL
jgi:hypothetical protein